MIASGDALRRAQVLIAERLGLDFGERRRDVLERALTQACRDSGVSAVERYLVWLETLPDESPEWRRLASRLTVGETYFFRDRLCFDALERVVLPSLIAARRADGVLRLRLWSAACASGEEPYSLAILLDRLLPDRAGWSITILATDINPEALRAARHGLYRSWSLRATPEWVRGAYFTHRGAEMFELDPRIRGMVTFAPLNLAADVYPTLATNTTAIDVILCRNALMYFTLSAQRATVEKLRQALVRDGWLVVSPVEASSELLRPLTAVTFPGVTFHRKEAASPVAAPPPAHVGTKEVVGSSLREPQAGGNGRALSIVLPSKPRQAALVDGGALLREARAEADRGSLERAADLCRAVLVRDRLDPEAQLLLAAICQERGEQEAALEALRAAIYLAPDSALAHFLLGVTLLRQGEFDRARRSMEAVIGLLSSIPRDQPVPGADGLTAGRLLETARAYLELSG